jgi:hypothetical protein
VKRSPLTSSTPLRRKKALAGNTSGARARGGPSRNQPRLRQVPNPFDSGQAVPPHYCIAAPGCEGRLDRHHVLPVQQLRKRGLDHLADDPRNVVPACRRHHANHHSRFAPLPASVLPEGVREFAAELGPWAVDYLERSYPSDAERTI